MLRLVDIVLSKHRFGAKGALTPPEVVCSQGGSPLLWVTRVMQADLSAVQVKTAARAPLACIGRVELNLIVPFW